MTHAKELWDEGSEKIPSGPNGPLGIFFMFFANNFFLKIGNLSRETEFRSKNLTFGGNWRLAKIFAIQFVFLESQKVWDKTVILCKQFFKKGSHRKIFRKLLWKRMIEYFAATIWFVLSINYWQSFFVVLAT